MEKIVALSVKHNVSDLHLCSCQPARWRRQGRLENAPHNSPKVETLLTAWLNGRQWQTLKEQGHLDFAVTLQDGLRLRVNAFYQRQGLSLALRILPGSAKSLAQLGTPTIVTSLLEKQEGLILVTGATGSGKSTTLAAMVDFINRHHARHIVTLEDPIELVHTSQKSLIQQREIGEHCASFAAGLCGALREDPDVILLGELRDRASIRLALTAAETGHLVLATLHTRGAAQAVERLLDSFSADEQPRVRAQLAGSLQAVLAQKLYSLADGERVALYELMINIPAVASLIREGKLHQLPGVLQTGHHSGMVTYTRSLQDREARMASATAL
ncbi:type IV pilus twitching motility protein PilT [Erwinia sp. HR93]|uniref:type IV pilus twitching motility protein PilT n=1 Tax=Erwinia sp. HR93 TaxID=3094840 RepID=UPI002ADEE9FA|nr:type IV pilus twitching motility protein PilT [Erwinia sp. HR93]MEA1062311.1 type IV pilus twitching motility protein PilT [Erwinia sp. HR93]